MDLTDWDFGRDGPVRLNGQWDFFWQMFVPPQSPPKALVPDSRIRVPGVWNGIAVNDTAIPGQGFATYRLVVTLPPGASGLGLKFLDAATAFTAYVNGKKVYASGIPGENKAATQPAYAPGVVALPDLAGPATLLIHTANFHHWQGGLWEPVTMGHLADLTRLREEKRFVSTLLFGSILIMGIYHLFLYGFRPRDRSTLYFGLFCLLVALRPLSHGERIIVSLFPDILGFSLMLKANYIFFYLCVPLFSHYLLTLFPRQISPRVVNCITWVWSLAALTPLVLPDTLFTALMPWMQYGTLCAVAYGCFGLVLAIQRKEPDAGIGLTGFLIFFITIANDILYTRQFISTAHLVPAGLFTFILCQAVILARRFSQAFDTVNRQQQELKAEMAERLKAEQHLMESERRFKTMADFLPVPLCETDVQLNLVYANKAALGWFGYDQEEMTTGLPLTEVIAEPGVRNVAQLNRHMKQTGEFLLRKKDGSRFWAQIHMSPILINSRLMGHRICFVDLTERKEAEAASLHEEKKTKYILVGQVAGKMSHDFNNVLGAIMGNAELSLMECRDDTIRESLEIIFEQTRRGQMLTQNLAAFAKDQDPIPECINLNEIMDTVLNLMGRDLENISVVKEYSAIPPEALADPGMIEQSIVNLIQNAIHAMSRTKRPQLRVKTFVNEGRAGIDISDNGCGIPPQHHKDIYTPSFTLKGSRDKDKAYASHIKGTGYGMANVKKYMDKHKADIGFTSVRGEGTTFTVSLPALLKECPVPQDIELQDIDPEEIDSQGPGKITGKNILVVEDETAISKVFFNILTHPPFDSRVTIATHGREAMNLLDREKFDLVSLDHMLAGTTTGMDVYRHIRKTDPDTPILFVSGNMAFIASIRDLIREDSRLSHLSKPCDNNSYARAVQRWLQS